MSPWYQELNKPCLTPPNWIFGPVWTVLYVMIACSIILYFRASAREQMPVVFVVLVVHLISNFVWTFFFFRLQSPFLALLDIIVLDLTLFCLLFLFWKVSTAAFALLVPYLFWVGFATYLNAGFYLLNRS